jgi:hypothetical protein
MRESEFYLDSDPETVFRGYTTGETWNGWACPYFDRAVGKQISEWFEAAHAGSSEGEYAAAYHSEKDAFLFREPAYDEPLVVESVKAEEKTLYPIGAYRWTWVEKRSKA